MDTIVVQRYSTTCHYNVEAYMRYYYILLDICFAQWVANAIIAMVCEREVFFIINTCPGISCAEILNYVKHIERKASVNKPDFTRICIMAYIFKPPE